MMGLRRRVAVDLEADAAAKCALASGCAAESGRISVRLRILSDLHLEFGAWEPPVVPADIVVLAGDIDKAPRGIAWAAARFADVPVVCVAGNHEYYSGSIPHCTEKLRKAAKGTTVRFLEMDEAVVGDIRFLGCTLWTDFALHGIEKRDAAKALAWEKMNDYRKIRVSPKYGKLRPADTERWHERSRAWLKAASAKPHLGPTVVVTHHAPSPRSLGEKRASDLLGCCYGSDLEPLMGAPGIDLWIHGHRHLPMDYDVKGTRVVSNPRGYPQEPAAGFRDDFVVEIG